MISFYASNLPLFKQKGCAGLSGVFLVVDITQIGYCEWMRY